MCNSSPLPTGNALRYALHEPPPSHPWTYVRLMSHSTAGREAQRDLNALAALADHEIWWRDQQEWLATKGYMLRPRYRPGWVPSWGKKTDYWDLWEHEDFHSITVRVELAHGTAD